MEHQIPQQHQLSDVSQLLSWERPSQGLQADGKRLFPQMLKAALVLLEIERKYTKVQISPHFLFSYTYLISPRHWNPTLPHAAYTKNNSSFWFGSIAFSFMVQWHFKYVHSSLSSAWVWKKMKNQCSSQSRLSPTSFLITTPNHLIMWN